MIDFKPVTLEDKETYQKYLLDGVERGCEYTFANIYLWGRQQATILHDHLVRFSQFNRRSVYPFPVGQGDKKAVLDALIADSKERGIPCRFTGVYEAEKETLETLYPGKFRFHCDRDEYDYVYDINNLADLPGSKYHKKRNHYNRFRENFAGYTTEPITEENLPMVMEMVENWYETRLQENPDSDFHMEKIALSKALRHLKELDMEGLILLHDEKILALTLGSKMAPDTFDVHFEKAPADVNGAYAAINCEFAKYIRDKYPEIKYLNREEDMGIEGLRTAKERYYPHHMVEKYWACLLEDEYEY